METNSAGLRVRAAGLSILVLICDQLSGSPLQACVAVARRQGQCVDQGIGGRPDLAQSDLRIFPPAAAVFGGPGTND